MSNKSEWGALGRFTKALLVGDVAGAATVLSEKPDVPVMPDAKEDDPPCARTDGDLVCIGHGIGGMCLFGTQAQRAANMKTDPAPAGSK